MAMLPSESRYRDLLARQVGGRIEVTLPFGRADVMTDTTVFEVEPVSSYAEGVRQALHYASQSGLRGALAAYGEPAKVEKIFNQLAELPPPGVEFWWFQAGKFAPIRTVEQAREVAANRLTERSCCDGMRRTGDMGLREVPCTNEPAAWGPVRLCQEHLDDLLDWSPWQAKPPPHCCRDHPNGCPKHPVTALADLKMAYESTGIIERLAWPHLSPEDRDTISAYLLELRVAIWHGAEYLPGALKAFGFDDDDDDD